MAKKFHEDGTPIIRYAFIDVYNTINTAKVLKFTIDWDKLYARLKDKFKCRDVYFYAGIELGDTETEEEYERLKEIGYQMRTKRMMVYKNKSKTVSLTCMKCHLKQPQAIDMGYQRKSNCDVELTMDVMLHAKPKYDLMIFTGDGDFTKLVEYAVDQGSTVKVIAHTKKGELSQNKRLSTALKALFDKEEVTYINLEDWIEAVKEDVV